jgi:hypothetical protein
MEFSLSLLLIPYALVVGLGGLLLFFNLYHLAKFGLEGGKTMSLMVAYGLGFLLCLAVSFEVILLGDWNRLVGPNDIFPFLTF